MVGVVQQQRNCQQPTNVVNADVAAAAAVVVDVVAVDVVGHLCDVQLWPGSSRRAMWRREGNLL